MERAHASRSRGVETAHTPRIQSGPDGSRLAGEFEGNITAERETDEKQRGRVGSAQFGEYVAEIAGKPRVIESGTQPFRAAASPHIESMGREALANGGAGETQDESRAARTFQAMNHDQLTRWRMVRVVRLQQNLHVGFSAEESLPAGHTGRDAGPRPEVARDGLPV